MKLASLRRAKTTSFWFATSLMVLAACTSRTFHGDSGDGDDSSQGGQGGSGDSSGGTGSGGGPRGDGGSSLGGGSGGVPADTEPTIESASIGGQEMKNETARGVAENDVIVVHFNVPMDKVATQLAYSSTDDAIRASNVVFSWDKSGTELTITPTDPLPYKSITDVETLPDVFQFAISTAARSKAGIDLETEFTASFSPRRRMTQTLQSMAALSGQFHHSCPSANNFVYGSTVSTGVASGCWMGPMPGGSPFPGVIRGFFHFSLAAVPIGVPIESASLTVGTTPTGNGWPSVGEATLIRVDYGRTALSGRGGSNPGTVLMGAESIGSGLAPTLTASATSRTYDVKAIVDEVLEQRAIDPEDDYVQYRVTRASGSSTPGAVQLTTRELVLVYVVP